jgi:hypothetical protein
MKSPSFSIAARMEALLKELPPVEARGLHDYCRSVPIPPPTAKAMANPVDALPFWLAFPVLLAGGTALRVSIERQLLDDILWGEYCLYISFRIEDDVRDGQASDASLAAFGRIMKDRAWQAFAPHFSENDEFVRLFDSHVQETREGIAAAERLQEEFISEPDRLLPEYAHTGAIFRIGFSAVCLAGERQDILPLLSAAADYLAIGGQIVDDIHDCIEDLLAGRYNYALQKIYAASCESGSIDRRILPAIPSGVLIGEIAEMAVHQFLCAEQSLGHPDLVPLNDIPRLHVAAGRRLLRSMAHESAKAQSGIGQHGIPIRNTPENNCTPPGLNHLIEMNSDGSMVEPIAAEIESK